MKSTSTTRQSGAVSLFVVIMAMLLISVVTIGFLRLMINNQIQATNNDLSQSAYDSAQAGVEDAKRALLRYKDLCVTGNGTATDCAVEKAKFTDTVACNTVIRDVINSSAFEEDGATIKEVRIQQTTNATNDAILDQAYTCVKAQLETADYEGSLTANSSQLIPLISTAPYDAVTVEWFERDDLTTNSLALSIPSRVGGQKLNSPWPKERPSVLRAQFMQVGGAFTLNGFDTTASGKSNANTVFLYPHVAGNETVPLTDRDIRSDTPGKDAPADADTANSTPLPVKCKTDLTMGGYACSIKLQLPEPVDGTATARIAYLRLTAFYNPTHFKVTLSSVGAPAGSVKFNGVQPVVDSTGRANDLFRRVESRIDMYDTGFPYPDAAVDVTGNFCKDFGVTDTRYIAGGCTP